MMQKPGFNLAAAMLLWPFLAIDPAAAQQSDHLRIITIDASRSIGTLRSLQGANGVPAPGHAKPFKSRRGDPPRAQNIDVSAGYRMARMNIIRTHDAYGAVDIDAHFVPPRIDLPFMARVPVSFDAGSIFQNMDADANDPASYNFALTDQVMASIHAIGANAIFRLGRSEGADTVPPTDFDKYANIARHIVLHYNQGWANGFRYGVKYWEVWNEPDLSNWFWDGTPQQYYSFYEKVARAVKAADASALVGGPSLALPNDATPYREAFLNYVREHKAPFDFLAWHWYAVDDADPYVFVRIADNLQQVLSAQGFASTPTILDEWNGGGFRPDRPTNVAADNDAESAAYIASALMYMQDAPIAHQTIYRADADYGADGQTPNRHGQAFIATGRMSDTPIRLSASGGDVNGLAVLAGRSQDGRTTQVLISNYQVPANAMGPREKGDVGGVPGFFQQTALPRRTLTYQSNGGYDLTIDKLKARRYIVERFRIDAGHAFALVDTQTLDGPKLRLTAKLPPPAVELLVIKSLP